MKKVAIVQSNYIPWKGYFDLIRAVDEFILYDDVQYTARDWRNRNLIKTERGTTWLTIPTQVKGKRFQAVKDTKISDAGWGRRHWHAIERAYAKAPFFKKSQNIFEPLFLGVSPVFLSELNKKFIEAIRDFLKIPTQVRFSMEYSYDRKGDKTEKLLSLCESAGASEYLCGPASKNYFRNDLFKKKGVAVTFADYSGYPEYRQLFPPFVHKVSILDLIFNRGHETLRYMKKL